MGSERKVGGKNQRWAEVLKGRGIALSEDAVWIQEEDMEEQTECADLHHRHHQPRPTCLFSQLNISQQVPASKA